MRESRLLTVLLASTAMFVACAVDPLPEVLTGDERIPINFSGSIKQEHTKATAQGFVDGDAVGLFAVNYSENNTVAGTLQAEGNQADNVKYVFNESAHKWSPVRPVYYKNVNTHVDLFLYYPYQSDITDVNAANFEVKKDQSAAATATALSGYEASDFLWGKGEDITPVESAIAITMNHRLSAVQVTLVENGGFADGEFESLTKSVIVTNTTRKATIDYSTGVATPLGSPQFDGIVMCPQTDGSFRAIVIPQSVPAETRLFAITIDGVTYGFKQSQAVEYQAGKQLNVSINITKKIPSGDYELELGSTQIIDWTEDLNAHGGEARQYYVVNVETPGTLGEVIAAAGKNPAKIRNLKITGQVNHLDFYFMRDSMDILEAINMKECRLVNVLASGYRLNDESKYGCWPDEYTNDVIPRDAFKDKSSLVYFVFPEKVTSILDGAFERTTLSGPLSLPDQVAFVTGFSVTRITGIQFPASLKCIGDYAFSNCQYISGSLMIPSEVEYIGSHAFAYCYGLNGVLELPSELEYLGDCAFYASGNFVGDLTIPEKINKVLTETFAGCSFSGSIKLSNVKEFDSDAFRCNAHGTLVIPEGVVVIPSNCFNGNYFSDIVFPSTIKLIKWGAFENCGPLCNPLVFPEGLVSIDDLAFNNVTTLPGVHFPSTLVSIGRYAFSGCFGLSSIICDAIEPPTALSDAFCGVAKDSFTLEVPPQSVSRYQAEAIWSEFRRIAAHYDFSLSRSHMRALNGSISRTYVLRAPANFTWSVDSENLPDWITVAPMSGTGKTDVTVTVSDMPRTSETFEVNEGTFDNPSYKNYTGRKSEVVFRLDEKDYTFTFNVEQYDYDYPDGYVQTLHTATKGPGIDFVFTGDGYDAKDIAKGSFSANASDGYEYLFDLEPYKTYKEYFNVYAVTAMSDDSGIGSLNTVKDSKFGTVFTQNRIRCEKPDDAFAWAKKANPSMDLSKSLVILLMNTSSYEGICYMYGDGSALACCPVSTEAYPYDFRGIVQHEAGGHGFGKLADEYIYHNAYIQNCLCLDGCDHPENENDDNSVYGLYKSKGWYKNLSLNSDSKQVPWAHLIYHPKYSDYVDVFEGGYMHSRGIYRSEATSCMNNNIPYYSAISRQAIVERIKEYAGETFDFDAFVANDKKVMGSTRSSYEFDRSFGVDPKFNRGSEHGSVIYMGEHPNVK